MSKSLWQAEFIVDASSANKISDMMEEWALSTEWHEQEMDSDVWVFHALFDFPVTEEEIYEHTPANLNIHGLRIDEMPDSDWLAESYRSFPPIEVGRFYIYGSHLTTPALGSQILPIKINAATAFGSGEHETTKGCIMAIDSLTYGNKTVDTMLDMGCGAGILAIAMAKATGKKVLAVDNDPEAVKVAKDNASENQVSDLVECILSQGFDQLDQSRKFDLVMANILANPLCEMADTLVGYLAPDGHVVVSGFLKSQESDVIGAYEKAGCLLVGKNHIGDWTTATLKRAA